MSKRSDEKLVPKNGHTMMVLIVCRISGCTQGNRMSQDSSRARLETAITPEFLRFSYVSESG